MQKKCLTSYPSPYKYSGTPLISHQRILTPLHHNKSPFFLICHSTRQRLLQNIMSYTQIPMFESASSIPPSDSSSSTDAPRTLRERCGFTLYISFAPAFPNIPAKGELGPTANNIPRRRKRSSVASIDIPAAPVVGESSPGPMEYFAVA
ncbi:hypothetical protein DFH06DRAFT_1344074 [Mycena polygramma]|nr:hypothetical protein DFH06DRAFT_1346129 [Mycena polygramma]KAJ7614745.1 hypothetical protein DFH06DRAFT_1344074 [Mycena polygramma]